jgi:hypothetical protein
VLPAPLVDAPAPAVEAEPVAPDEPVALELEVPPDAEVALADEPAAPEGPPVAPAVCPEVAEAPPAPWLPALGLAAADPDSLLCPDCAPEVLAGDSALGVDGAPDAPDAGVEGGFGGGGSEGCEDCWEEAQAPARRPRVATVTIHGARSLVGMEDRPSPTLPPKQRTCHERS